MTEHLPGFPKISPGGNVDDWIRDDPKDQWTHIGIVIDQQDKRIDEYRNGVRVKRYYSRVLGVEEVLAHYLAEKDGSEPPPPWVTNDEPARIG